MNNKEAGPLKKFFLSLTGGILLGGILSYFFLDYEDSNYVLLNYYGADKKIVKEWDFQFISNAGFIIIGLSVLIFLIWTYFERRSNGF
ncbi:hypothetical protein CYJ37_20525 [Bacillus sp. UMB0728]|nr:hypothetical protein CYJ37_20525 [Bacillus sp. UMB0728]